MESLSDSTLRMWAVVALLMALLCAYCIADCMAKSVHIATLIVLWVNWAAALARLVNISGIERKRASQIEAEYRFRVAH